MESNTEKFDAYRRMKADLKKAMAAGFYYQAIFIEYAIVEDRCCSALKYAGVKYQDKNGHDFSLSKKINTLKNNPVFAAEYPRSKLPIGFLDELDKWKHDRDDLVHHLANLPYDDDALRQTAERGKLLIDRLSDRVNSVNNYCKRLNLQSKAK